MDDPSAVDVLQTAQDLVDQKLDMIIRQFLRAYYVVQIGVHQVGHHVHLLELIQRIGGLSWMKDIQQTNNVLVIHVLQQPQFPIGALRMDRRLEGPGKLLDGHLRAGSADHGLADLAVGTLTHGLQVLVCFRDFPLGAIDVQLVEFGHFARHFVGMFCTLRCGAIMLLIRWLFFWAVLLLACGISYLCSTLRGLNIAGNE